MRLGRQGRHGHALGPERVQVALHARDGRQRRRLRAHQRALLLAQPLLALRRDRLLSQDLGTPHPPGIAALSHSLEICAMFTTRRLEAERINRSASVWRIQYLWLPGNRALQSLAFRGRAHCAEPVLEQCWVGAQYSTKVMLVLLNEHTRCRARVGPREQAGGGRPEAGRD